MIIVAVGPAATAPLLHVQSGQAGAATGSSTASSSCKPGQVDLRFRRRFFRILRLLRPYPALGLAALSILESVAVAEVGKVAGSFYRIVVDDQPALLAGAMLWAATLYAACCCIYAAATWLAQSLAVSWRERLTSHLQQLYCGDGAFYKLLHEVDNPDQRIAFDASALCDSLGSVVKVAAAAPFKVAYYGWLTAGYIGWRGLAAVFGFFWVGAGLQRLVMAPVARTVFDQEAREGDLRFAHLRLREYAAEAAQYGAGAAEGRQLARALGAAVENQRRLVFRRVLLGATTRGIDYCGAMLNYGLVAAAVFAGMAGAGGDSGRLAQWVSNASFATLMLIYSFTELLDLSQQLSSMAGLTARVGQLLEALNPPPLNPSAAPAHADRPPCTADATGSSSSSSSSSGSGGGWVEGGGPGIPAMHAVPPLPQQLSQAMLDGGSGGVLAAGMHRESPRRRRLWNGLWWRGAGRAVREGYEQLAGSPRGGEARVSIDGEELRPSAFAEQLLPPTHLPAVFPDASSLEISIHRLGPDLRQEVMAIFPGVTALAQPPPQPPLPASAPQQQTQQPQPSAQHGQGPGAGAGEGAAVLACLTFQCAVGGVSLAPDRSAATLDKASAEMDRMLDHFLRWEHAVHAELAKQGLYWSDAIDPRNGMALRGQQGARWSEVAAAHALLGYERREAGICPVIAHPTYGTAAYPATLFTNAPLHALQAAIAVASHPPGPGPSPGPASPAGAAPAASPHASSQLPLPQRSVTLTMPAPLEFQGVTLRRLDGGVAVAGLTLTLPPGCHLLISGPNGCGKSTLVKALCGFYPLEAGWVQVFGTVVAAGRESGGGGDPAGAGGDLVGAAAGGGPAVHGTAGPDTAGQSLMVVPQRPLAAPGPALWQQVVYPDARRPPDGELRRLLAAVGLGYLEERGEAGAVVGEEEGGWGTMLSPGELQRLSVARVLHRRPALAVLDEVTASVSLEAAVSLYRELQGAGVACVSVGQDCAHLRSVHTHHLRLGVEGRGEGAWELQTLEGR